ncbi:MAG TPA: hypothetical protein VJV03_12350 [Pyrinomonadaceae bacterium]|nr:hypothetical protein [Pyrinomonadaceae bacterium]
MDERQRDKGQREEGWESNTATSGEEALRTEERSLDVGESGQHAPGGYYNQQGVNAPDRSTLNNDDL